MAFNIAKLLLNRSIGEIKPDMSMETMLLAVYNGRVFQDRFMERMMREGITDILEESEGFNKTEVVWTVLDEDKESHKRTWFYFNNKGFADCIDVGQKHWNEDTYLHVLKTMISALIKNAAHSQFFPKVCIVENELDSFSESATVKPFMQDANKCKIFAKYINFPQSARHFNIANEILKHTKISIYLRDNDSKLTFEDVQSTWKNEVDKQFNILLKEFCETVNVCRSTLVSKNKYS